MIYEELFCIVIYSTSNKNTDINGLVGCFDNYKLE